MAAASHRTDTPHSSVPRILIVAGPTGVGKTEAALLVAEELAAEIISADSRQVYQGLEIGTAAPGTAELARVPHHLVSERDPRRAWSAGEFARQAAAAARDILARGHLPMVVGGSGFYLQALQEGIFAEPPADPARRAALRRELRRRCSTEGPERLHAELMAADPAWAAAIEPTDSQRIVRGLEAWQLYGTPLSELQAAEAADPPIAADFCTLLLERDRADLYARIDRRVTKQFERGWLEEARALQQAGVPPDAPGLSGLGYEALFAHLAGEVSQAEAVEMIRREHRRYAKRQLTWFRRFTAERIALVPEDGAEATAARILAAWRSDSSD